ncbi:hypothetical protein [Deinococcus alpinitundrae]|uniref:hypothetical protein n=1 Tax=Deinococcus alpinitundrae TaxID=468913 RepID=UPI00137AF27B|nr:hypothetical protein [Deinococcus alpinitundrae]
MGQLTWTATTAYTLGQTVNTTTRVYRCSVAGTSSATAPTHTTGSATDGTVTWDYVGALVGAYGVGAINGVVDPVSRAGSTMSGAFVFTNGSPLQFNNGWVMSTFTDNPAVGENIFYIRSSAARNNLDWIGFGSTITGNRLKGVKFRAYSTYLDAPDGTWQLNVGRSGTTANRPTTTTVPYLYVGMPYYDTTLNKPIWVKTASATPVWVDATGTTV